MADVTDLRVGIVGLGNIGHYHADRLRDLGVELVGGMDIEAGARARFERKYGTRVFEDHDALYERADAVIVTTPNRFHESYAVSALEADLDVLLEKPLAHTVERGERIAEAAAASNGFCMVGFHNRYRNPIEILKRFERTGRFGEITHVEANYVRRRGIPGRGSWFTNKAVSGGGALIDIGVHALDLALYLLDFSPVVEVSGVARADFGGRPEYTYLEMWGRDAGSEAFDVDDQASAFIRCADGSTISLEVAWAANRPTNDEFVIHGTEAGASFDRAAGSVTLHEVSSEGAPHFSDAEIETREEDPHAAEQHAFLQAVRDGTPPERNTIEQGLAVQQVIEAIYRSSDEGRAIRLDEPEAKAATRPE